MAHTLGDASGDRAHSQNRMGRSRAPRLRSRDLRTLNASRLAAILDSLPLILFEVDRDGHYTLCVGHGLELIGKDSDEFTGRSAAEMFPGNKPLQENHVRALAGEAFSDQIQVDTTALQSTYRPIHGPSGELLGFRGIALDVTDWAHAVAERAASEERVRVIADSVPLLLMTADCDEVITAAEGKGFSMLGIVPSQALGRTACNLFPQASASLHPNHRRALNGETFATRIELGGRTWDFRFQPTFGRDGAIDGFCSVGLDVTDQVRSDAAVVALQRRDAGLAELSRAAVAGAATDALLQAAVTLVAREIERVDLVYVSEIAGNELNLRAIEYAPGVQTEIGTRKPVLRGVILRQLQRAGESFVVDDWSRETRVREPKWLADLGVRSSIGLPVIGREGQLAGG